MSLFDNSTVMTLEALKMVPLNEYLALKMEVDTLNKLVNELSGKLEKLSRQTVLENHTKGIGINSKGICRFINVKDITMIKAESNYSLIYLLSGETILTSKTLKYWQEKCTLAHLKRIHKSYLINTKHMIAYDSKGGNVIMKGGISAKCSLNRKDILP